jgi:hypothetical protein
MVVVFVKPTPTAAPTWTVMARFRENNLGWNIALNCSGWQGAPKTIQRWRRLNCA